MTCSGIVETVTPKLLSICDVIVVQESSCGDEMFTFYGRGSLSSHSYNKITLLGVEDILSRSCTKWSFLKNYDIGKKNYDIGKEKKALV